MLISLRIVLWLLLVFNGMELYDHIVLAATEDYPAWIVQVVLSFGVVQLVLIFMALRGLERWPLRFLLLGALVQTLGIGLAIEIRTGWQPVASVAVVYWLATLGATQLSPRSAEQKPH